MILILENEELVGAKQNRIINRTNLIQGNSTTVIPASCVEQVRASLRVPREHRSDRSTVWDEKPEKTSRRDARSPGMAMAETYEKDRPSIYEYVKQKADRRRTEGGPKAVGS